MRGAVVLSLVMSCAWATFGQRLITRPFWMDELHTWLLVTDSDPGHAMSALADGVDFNPPSYYLVARATSVFGPVTEFGLRLLSLVCTMATMVAIYLMLTRRLSASISVTATLFAAAHPLMVLQSTEARFYALWLCLLMWYCWLLTKTCDGDAPQWLRRLTLGVLAAAVCTTHYFGIISVVLVTATWTLCHRRNRGDVLLSAVLMCCAAGAVACCLPILNGQKAALTCATWVKPPTIAGSVDFMLQFLPVLPLGICTGAAVAAWVSRQQTIADEEQRQTETSSAMSGWSPENSVLLSLLLMPFVLIVFSWLVQPALVNRYAIVAVVGMVPVYAWLLSKTTTVIRKTTVGIVAILLALGIHHGSDTWDFNLQKHDELNSMLAELPPDELVVFEDRIDFWLLQHQHKNALPWYQADFERDQLRRPSNLRTVQRDVGRRTAKWYPKRFPMKSMGDLKHVSQFVVVTYIDKPFGELRFPNEFHAERLNDRMYRLRKKPSLSAHAKDTAFE